jgi:ectoine hydroxylase-related dioxygenase (phytanoyl-CoA dioxygenase family)
MTTTIERHRWNTDFTWRDHDGPFRVITEQQAAQFDRDGFFVMEDVFARDVVERAIAEIDEAERGVERFLQQQAEGRAGIAETGAITFTTHLVARSPWLRDLTSSMPLAGIAADLLGPDVRLYWDQAVYKKPEKPRRFPWHQDNGYAFVDPQQYLTCWIALTDATVENGCPQVARGHHREGTLRHRYVDPLGFECFSDPDDVAMAPVGAGGIVVFSSLTPHLTGPNTTDAVRKANIVQYAPDGAAVLEGEARNPPQRRVRCEAPERQFVVVRGGEVVGS